MKRFIKEFKELRDYYKRCRRVREDLKAYHAMQEAFLRTGMIQFLKEEISHEVSFFYSPLYIIDFAIKTSYFMKERLTFYIYWRYLLC